MEPTHQARVDERDTVFARAARVPGTPQHAEYYGRRPELLSVDDALRRLPALGAPGGRRYEAGLMGQVQELFARIEVLEPEPAEVRGWAQVLDGPGAEPEARRMLRDMGAVAVGATRLDPSWVYTHKGRLDSDCGRELSADLPWALVFLVQMDHAEMQHAPGARAFRESARQYWRAARVALTASAAIRQAGFQARAQYDAHYEVMLVPLAVQAGLGELGRNNILVADRFGSRVRMGAILTDLPLTQDTPVDLGVRHFCQRCRKCADACPSGSLSQGEPEEIRGVSKWPTRTVSCYRYWRVQGTDCGICMAVCPFSHKDSPLHNGMRRVIERVPAVHRLAVLGDDLLYGRGWTSLSEMSRQR